MDRQVIGRREILRTVGVAAGGVALTTAAMASSAHADDDHDDDDDNRRRKLNGSWMATVTVEGEPDTTMSVVSFATGGVAIIHDINPAGPPFTGSWARTGGNGFRATLWSGFPGQGGPGAVGGTARLQLIGNVRGNGTIDGTFTATEFDGATGDEVGQFEGTFVAERIVA